MLSLEAHHMVDLFCWVDDHLPKTEKKRGRPSALTDSELITILLWSTIVLEQKTWKSIHRLAWIHLRSEFPRMPHYNAFLDHCHRALPLLWQLLQETCSDASVRIVDSTMLDVCRLHRASRHRVAKIVASYSKNHQGWHYGFKLHLSVNMQGVLCKFFFTPANVYDGQVLPELIDHKTDIVVGDNHYNASVMRRYVQELFGTIVIAPPHTTQKKKISAPWQLFLLNWRSKIECVFDRLKEHLHLVSSFPRSINGYLLHYVRILLSYQILALSWAG